MLISSSIWPGKCIFLSSFIQYWSIGGFAVSWLTKHYPDVRGVVLDACFDSITPLAQQSMPKFASNVSILIEISF